MPKFSATKLTDLMTDARNAGRLQRGVFFIVACEASDGSWCEFDAESSDHAKVLADNAVDKLGARGCSVWAVNAETGAFAFGPALYHVYAGAAEPTVNGRTKAEVREAFRDEKLDYPTAISMLQEVGFENDFAADQYLFAE